MKLLFFYKDNAARSAGADGRSLRLLRETGGALSYIPTKKINKSMKKIYDEVQKATEKDVKALEDFGIDTVLSIF